MRPLFLLIVLCANLGACGQTGALYIPQEEPPTSAPPPAPAK